MVNQDILYIQVIQSIRVEQHVKSVKSCKAVLIIELRVCKVIQSTE